MIGIQILIFTLLGASSFAQDQTPTPNAGQPMALPDFSKVQKTNPHGSDGASGGIQGSVQCQNEDGRMLNVGEPGYEICLSKLRPTNPSGNKDGKDSPRVGIKFGK